MSVPKVSVIIPTYNSGKLALEAVCSVLAQTQPAHEVIVVDDGSTDQTQTTLSPVISKIKFISQKNKGRSVARNCGIAHSSGDYIAFLDADDIWYPEKLEKQLAFLQAYPAAGWSYCKTHLVDESGNLLLSDFWPDVFGSGNPGINVLREYFLTSGMEISTSTVLVESSLFQKVGFFNERLPTSEDTELWARLSMASPILFMPDILATRRVNSQESFLDRWSRYETSDYGIKAAYHALTQMGTNKESIIGIQILQASHLNSAFIEFALGRVDSAERYWLQVINMVNKHDFWRSLPSQLAHFSLAAARYHRNGEKLAQQILNMILAQLPLPSSQLWKIKTQSRSELYAIIAHLYGQKKTKQSYQQASSYARKALCANYSLWKNIGLWKLALGINELNH